MAERKLFLLRSASLSSLHLTLFPARKRKRKKADMVDEDYDKILQYLRNPDANKELKREAGKKKWNKKYFLRAEVHSPLTAPPFLTSPLAAHHHRRRLECGLACDGSSSETQGWLSQPCQDLRSTCRQEVTLHGHPQEQSPRNQQKL